MSALDWRRANDNARMRQRRSEFDRRIAQRPQTAEPTGIRATATEAGRAPRGWEVLGKPTRRGRDRRAARI